MGLQVVRGGGGGGDCVLTLPEGEVGRFTVTGSDGRVVAHLHTHTHTHTHKCKELQHWAMAPQPKAGTLCTTTENLGLDTEKILWGLSHVLGVSQPLIESAYDTTLAN